MNLNLIKPPATEPLSLPELKSYLRLDDGFADDDAYLEAMITAAREYCETFQNRAYITQTWQLSFHYWPDQVITIPRGNLQRIDTITYKDSTGEIHPITENAHYVVSTRGVLGRVAPVFGQPWPPFVPWPLDAVLIEFDCGYGDTAESVPEKVKQAMKLLVSHWYENRTPLNDTGQVPGEIAFTVSALLWQDRIIPA